MSAGIPGIQAAVPYVLCSDAGAVSDWCQQILGLEERSRWTDDDGIVTNVELRAGDSEVWLDGPVPDWPQRLEGLGSWIGILVDDVDAVYNAIRPRVASLEPPVDREFGARLLTLRDPEGHEWSFIQRT
jgi:MerR family transcriptional regulator, thiopeptide resistance regulator